MHHKKKNNNIHSSDNHDRPQHEKYPTQPVRQEQKRSIMQRFRESFKEKPATKEEVAQLRLDAQREVYKTQKMKAKSARPSRFGNFGGTSSGRTGHSRQSDPLGGGSWLMGSGEGPSLNFITGGGEKTGRRKKNEPAFGQGLTDLF